MSKLFLDVWHDLRSRKLWPVALLLAVALVAVPVVLKKSPSSSAGTVPAGSASASGSTATPAVEDSKPVVVAASDTGTSASKLGVFNKKNPFKPDLPKVKAASTQSSSQPSSSNSSSSSSSNGGSRSSGGGNGGSSGGGTTTTPAQPKGPMAYVVDLKFGKRDATKTHHNVQKLDVLPDSNNPLLVFMGVNSAGDTAIFLTDTSLKASGEGDCKPSPDVCSFLYLKVDKQSDTEDLLAQSPDGTGIEYTLKLLDIKKVPVSELAKQAAAKQSKEAAAESKNPQVKPATPFHWRYDLPQLPDLVDG